MMDRQKQIDRIAEWMGWNRHHVGLRGRLWYWEDAHTHKVAESFFCPFTNPSDCAMVMDKVVEHTATYKVDYDPIDECWSCELAIPEGVGNVGSFESEMDAKMMALIEAIR